MNNFHMMKTLDFRAITFVHGQGPWLVDADGKRYLDFFCDVGTASLGYSSHEQVRALARMLNERIPFHAPNLYGFKERTRVAERLCLATDMDKAFFCNSGTEAVEAAIKLARLYQHKRSSDKAFARKAIYSFKGGFHGRTYGGLSAGDGPPYHTEGFGPLLQEFGHFERIEHIDSRAAAVILSPVFGNNDVRDMGTTFLRDLATYCRQNDIVLIFDEVQTGSGRTGGDGITYAQRIGVRPDVITLAKGVAMGAPVGAMLAHGPIADTFTPGTHFSTFGGNPLSVVCVGGMLDWLEENPGRADMLGQAMRESLEGLGWPKNIRGPGALLAFDCDVDTLSLSKACLDEGLLIGAFRPGPGPVKVTPPLNLPAAQVEEGIAMLGAAYKRVKGVTK